MDAIQKYFSAEKSESIFFVGAGCLAILAAIWLLLKVKQPFYSGMAYPLLMIAFIQIMVGSSVYWRSPKDIVRVTEMVQNNQARISTEEIPRMKVVMKNFVIYRWIEIILIAIGIALFIFAAPQTMLRGIGLGLSLQASIMLLLDFFAESRGKIYLEYLRTVAS